MYIDISLELFPGNFFTVNCGHNRWFLCTATSQGHGKEEHKRCEAAAISSDHTCNTPLLLFVFQFIKLIGAAQLLIPSRRNNSCSSSANKSSPTSQVTTVSLSREKSNL